ncbi:hypothetical protein F4809DRAFT_635378 [Biscogniauxia mediterranea]|nr:hypothetical protein F4809DRAFT_635378 [Biscogniauxia mediterranea]
MMIIAALMLMTSVLGFANAFWQHIGAAGASTLLELPTYDTAEAQIGATAMTFGWLGASCACVTTIGIIINDILHTSVKPTGLMIMPFLHEGKEDKCTTTCT